MKSLTASGRCVFYKTRKISIMQYTAKQEKKKKDIPWSSAAAVGKPPVAWPIETHHS
jgi:hypothetical protein